jgi:hypothetical protein
MLALVRPVWKVDPELGSMGLSGPRIPAMWDELGARVTSGDPDEVHSAVKILRAGVVDFVICCGLLAISLVLIKPLRDLGLYHLPVVGAGVGVVFMLGLTALEYRFRWMSIERVRRRDRPSLAWDLAFIVAGAALYLVVSAHS